MGSFTPAGACGTLLELLTHSSRYGLRSFARFAGYDTERVTPKGLVKRREDERSSSFNNFALDEATVAVCPIQTNDSRLPPGFRA